jgi:hypothetical protein
MRSLQRVFSRVVAVSGIEQGLFLLKPEIP